MKKLFISSMLLFISAFAFGQSITLEPQTPAKRFSIKSSGFYGYFSTNSVVEADLSFLRDAIPTGTGAEGTTIGKISTSASGSHFNIGTVNSNINGNFNLRTQDINRMIISSSGDVKIGTGSGVTPNPSSLLFVEKNASNYLGIASPNAFESGILFGKPTLGAASAGIVYNTANNMDFRTEGNQTRFVIKADGTSGVVGLNLFELGVGVAGKEINAGKIGYNSFGTDALVIVGAGTITTNRKVRFFAEGGLMLDGEINKTSSGAANLIPIAYGVVNADGTISSGTGNFTITHPATGIYKITVNGVSNYLDVVSTAIYESAPNFSSIYTDVSAGISIGISQQHMELIANCATFPVPPYPCLANIAHDGKFSFVAYKP